MRTSIPCLLPLALLGCQGGGPVEVEPEPPDDLQLKEGFHRAFTRAYGCDMSLGSAPRTNAVLFDDEGTLRLSADQSQVTVSLGQALDTPMDDDYCDDLFSGVSRAERWMVYTANEDADIRIYDDDGVRVYEVYELVLTPTESDWADPADYQPLALDRLILGAIVLGGQIEDLRP